MRRERELDQHAVDGPVRSQFADLADHLRE